VPLSRCKPTATTPVALDEHLAAALEAVLAAVTTEERKAAVAEYDRLLWAQTTAGWTDGERADYNRREHEEANRRNERNRRTMLAHRRFLAHSRPDRFTRWLRPMRGAVSPANLCRQRPTAARAPRGRRVVRVHARSTDDPHDLAHTAGGNRRGEGCAA
jgi:hypothetical protein